MDANDRQENGPDEQPTAEGPQAPAGDPAAPPQKRLTRSRSDRIVGGVCGGLGRYFNVDPIFFRVGAVVLAFIGGAGVLLYLAALLLVPTEDQAAPIAPGTQRNRGLVILAVVVILLVAWPFLLFGGALFAGLGIPLALLVGTGVLVWWLVSGEGPSGDAGDIARRAALGVGVLILCFLIAIAGAFAAAAGPDWLVPALVIVAGAAIAAGAFLRPVRWLVLPALTLGLAAGAVSAAGVNLDGGIGQREYRPGSTAEVRDHYKVGIGELVVDLRNADLPKGDVPLKVDVGIGQARLIVPQNVCVATDVQVGIGNVHAFGLDNGGVDVNLQDTPRAAPTATRLLVRGDVGVGELRVQHTADEFRFGDSHFRPFHNNGLDLSAAQPAACSPAGQRASG
jgi:phage shock protein PspC (stress-responsive transcriptional regulator)